MTSDLVCFGWFWEEVIIPRPQTTGTLIHPTNLMYGFAAANSNLLVNDELRLLKKN